jgi:amidase
MLFLRLLGLTGLLAPSVFAPSSVVGGGTLPNQPNVPNKHRQHLERVIDRLQHKERSINAFIDIDLVAAREQAASLDKEDVKDKEKASATLPLGGVVVAVKDNIHVAGFRTTAGTRQLASFPLAPGLHGDALVVQRLRSAGAVIIGTTNMDTWARGVRGISEVAGQTANPLDPTRNAGGSSAGSAAAVAAGMADLGIGTDTCGSIRYPASSVALYGLKPTWGVVPLNGVVPLAPGQDVVGPLAANPDTLAVGWSVLSGRVVEPVTLSNRLGVLSDGGSGASSGLGSVSPAWRRAAEAAGFTLVDAGTAPSTSGVNLIELQFSSAKRAYLSWRAGKGTESWIADSGVIGEKARRPAQEAVLKKRVVLAKALGDRMKSLNVDALIYPTNQALPAKLGARQVSGNCMLASGSGLPALAVPGVPATGEQLSIGVDLLGRPNDENRLLAVAKQLAAAKQLAGTKAK